MYQTKRSKYFVAYMPGSKVLGSFCIVGIDGNCANTGKSAKAFKSEGYKIIPYEQAVKEIRSRYGEEGERL